MAYFPDSRDKRNPGYEARNARLSRAESFSSDTVSTRRFSSSYDDGFDDLDTSDTDNSTDALNAEYDEDGNPIPALSPEELSELRKSNSRVVSGVASFIAVIVGVVIILILVSLLISLFNFLSSDISQTFTLFRNNI